MSSGGEVLPPATDRNPAKNFRPLAGLFFAILALMPGYFLFGYSGGLGGMVAFSTGWLVGVGSIFLIGYGGVPKNPSSPS